MDRGLAFVGHMIPAGWTVKKADQTRALGLAVSRSQDPARMGHRRKPWKSATSRLSVGKITNHDVTLKIEVALLSSPQRQQRQERSLVDVPKSLQDR